MLIVDLGVEIPVTLIGESTLKAFLYLWINEKNTWIIQTFMCLPDLGDSWV